MSKRPKCFPSKLWASACGCQQRGFSLLEVIVAVALATVLLGSVWSLFQILTKRQAIELRQAESNQLIRSLHQRFTRDLNNLPAMESRAELPLPSAVDINTLPESALFWPFNLSDHKPAAVSTRKSMVLQGDQSTLTLAQFVEPCEWEEFPDADATASRRTLETNSPQLLKEVVYQLPRWPMLEGDRLKEVAESDSELQIDGDQEPPSPELVREEILPQTLPRSAWPAAGTPTIEDDEFGDRQPIHQRLQDQDFADQSSLGRDASIRRETLEDISVAAFAYFDGYRWRMEWNSDLEQRLPVAIRFRWRQAAIPATDSRGVSTDFSIAMPPAELRRQESSVESNVSDQGGFESASEASAEAFEPRWYEGEWIFLLQPATVPRRLPAESKFGFKLQLFPGSPERAAGSRTTGGCHG